MSSVASDISTETASISAQDLASFVGHNVAPFEKVRARLASGEKSFSWVWLVFLFPPAWFGYRRAHAWSLILFVFVAAISVLEAVSAAVAALTGTGVWALALCVMFAVMGRRMLVDRAAKFTDKADRLNLIGSERSDFLSRSGNPSVVWAIVTSLLFVLFVVVVTAMSQVLLGQGIDPQGIELRPTVA